MSTNPSTALRAEFEAEKGSFLLQLRIDLTWDRHAFRLLVEAMEAYCRETEDTEKLDRWAAQGFWYFSWYVRSWTTHPNFPREHLPEYYEAAYERLEHLAYWFFFGESPFQNGTGFDPLP